MSALRFAVFGKSRLAAARCHALAACERTQIAKAWSTEQIAEFSENDWSKALDPDFIDAVVFALPAGETARASRVALKRGIHVLSELPGGETVEDIINMREAERDSGAVLKFGCGLRYHASIQAASDEIASGKYGRLLTARAVYGHAGRPHGYPADQSILIGHGIHILDLLHLFCGPFESVKAMATGASETSDNIFAVMRTGDDVVAQLHSSATSWRQTFRLELGFANGYVWLDGHLPGLEGYGPEMLICATYDRDPQGNPLPNPDETITEFNEEASAAAELGEFLAAIAGTALVRHGSSHHAFDAMNVAQRICAACETWA